MVYLSLQSVEKSRTEFYFAQRFALQKLTIARQPPVLHCAQTVQLYGNLSRKSIARQVAEKTAQYNRALYYNYGDRIVLRLEEFKLSKISISIAQRSRCATL